VINNILLYNITVLYALNFTKSFINYRSHFSCQGCVCGIVWDETEPIVRGNWA
jgi:hypothetical protein